MITYLLGLPGSGKSYYAVDKIFNNFSNHPEAVRDKKATYTNCYTNINEFKFNFLENVNPLDFEKLYNVLERLHKHYKAKKTDDYLKRFLKKCKYFDTLFVIDEAHNYFDKKDLVLVWWLSYHRHLHHEIILITQNIALIEAKYKSFSEFFYVAKPQSLSLFKSNFTYVSYVSSRLSEKSRVGTFKIKRNKKVFDLYHSGDSINTQNVVLKFMTIALVLTAVLFTAFYFFINSKTSEHEEQIKATKPPKKEYLTNINNTQKVLPPEPTNYSELTLLTIYCNKSYCFDGNLKVDTSVFNHYVNSKEITIIYKSWINLALQKYNCSMSNDLYKFLKGGQNEESFNSSLNVSSIMGK